MMKSKTRIHKNRDSRELTVERMVALPQQLAWEGWTKPEHIARWWGPKLWTSTVYEMDVRPGGVWRYSLKSDDNNGEEAFCKAVYQEVNEPSLLVYTDSFADKDWNIVENSEMLTTVQFEAATNGTKLSIVTRFSSAEELDNAEAMGMVEGFTEAFDRLEIYLETLTGGHINTVISKDGTKIAYKKQGNGPAVILIASAIADHRDAAKLAEKLAAHFTVYNYDRRGRGQSSDVMPYAVQREVEDIETLIHTAGGNARLFGSSSGAVLALEAASRLGDQVTKIYLYEPPFIINDSRKPVPTDYVQHLNTLNEAGRRSEAVEYFMSEALGIPAEYIGYIKADPSWQAMESMSHTLAYDGMIMSDTQSGKPLPTNRWKVNVPTLIMTGENSEPLFHDAAKALAKLLPIVDSRTLTGQDHSAVVMAPNIIAKTIFNYDIVSKEKEIG
ncbi:alpha/beta fold hydrolase [Paenibacillus sp. FJAT-27812]|uniref:alpha/beta fold hydrolase n=1 Tax=Paenibacillus sp. FJAT-27812 TaxID=1684143 RepID=UPI001E5CC367|nr:alpha/beta fold hydrolase [Paenibacillus sp. FJAT-27812]